MPQLPPLKPRKLPRQKRSQATVEAIFQATIQVLLAEGVSKLTTTHVAERAGVSVGTMYQYFPHKHALLYALLEKYLAEITESMESACVRLKGQPLAVTSDGLAAAFFEATISNLQAARAVYSITSELDASNLVSAISKRFNATIRMLLASITDASFHDLDAVTYTLQQALGGTVVALFDNEVGPTPPSLKKLGVELPLLCRAYLAAASRPV